MNDEWENVRDDYPGYEMVMNPEGQGVNVEETLKLSGIDLDWSKTGEGGEIISVAQRIYRVAFIGKRIEN